LCLGPLYAVLQQLKLLASVDAIFRKFEEWFINREPFKLVTIENSFKVQISLELIFSTFPQLIIQSNNNNKSSVGWNGLAIITMIVIILMFIKNVAFLTIYTIRRMIDGSDDAQMRPQTGKQMSKLEMEAFNCI
jgi:disulfide bond formation protein DsbB